MSDAERPADIAMIEAGCRVLGIPLDPAWHDAIVFNLRVIAAQSQALIHPALADETEPGPVFTS